ncbi:Gfo/Idh/MocA family protein [Pedosphaera parvula]|uniref:Oxidoreductase domain protein n=1 Tax=Pedosphaera parvula (strain Ellin514) TaxID=320771 RepID=B9XFJ2_PEDPL|nr:Gfo/Idh/MocA family oxidoreductase [Pedosphaera parvula]EEF61356.1 oxidoreductase domain protein [Pedosphaera parvula Ellin514]
MSSPIFDSKVTRRKFLGFAGAALAFPTIIPGRALGLENSPAPSQRINLGLVGCGNMGTANSKAFLGLKDCQVVAACDVDKQHLKKMVNLVNKHYQNKDCKAYHDFRELMARTDIDAVMLAVPDHWHELVAVEAARHKKDIYGEKPLGRTIAEQQAMVKAVQENKRIWQTGSWQRSEANFHKAAEIVRNGLIGDVTRIEVGLPGGNNNSGNAAESMTPSDPPSDLDYDAWIGPSQMMPYIQGRVHRNWRWNYNTGGGQLMDWVGHHCDIAHWGCDFDNSGPSEIEGHGEFPPKDAVWNTCTKYRIELRYPRNITMIMAGGYEDIRSGVKWIGTKGWVWVNRGAFEASNEDWRDYKNLPEEMRKVKLYVSTDHRQNFLDCIKSRKATITPVETAHHSAIPGHLGLISMLVGRKLKWDVQTECIQGDPEASQLLTRPFRSPWKLG